MITQFSKLFIVILIFTQSSFAAFKTKVLTRDEDMDLVEKVVTLSAINSEGLLEDENFKVVSGKSNEALILSQIMNEKERMRAASVYFHLMKAKTYFLEEVKSDYVKQMKQLTIRLNIKNQFNSIGHFAHDNLSPEYNNALSIPPGEGRAKFGIKPWDYEIWFRPAKVISLPKEGTENDFNEVSVLFKEFRNQSRMASFQKFVADMFVLNSTELTASGLNLLGSTAILEASFIAMKYLYGFIQPKNFMLDTSFVPEIVYHEFAHVALSDHLTLSHSSPVNEGMADFFAAAIAKSSKIAHNIKGYAKRVREKDAFRDELYQVGYESNAYANIDFVLGVLWQVRQINEKRSNEIIYNVRKNINSSSTIRKDLVRSILKECRKSCESPFRDRIKLLDAYDDMGL